MRKIITIRKKLYSKLFLSPSHAMYKERMNNDV